MEDLLKQAEGLQEDLVKIRRYLHETAETGFALVQTVDYVCRQLKSIGCEIKKCGRAGITTTIGKGERCSLLRADMDALPIAEQTGVKFACKNGHMHACGHDLHTTALLGTARLLKSREKQLNGTVKLLFQPAEEILEGAQSVIKAGALTAPKVHAAVMLHVLTAVDLPAGTAVVASGGVSAPAADYFTIRVKGKGCHGSAPWNGVDALTAAAHILLALQEISARELSISNPAVLTIGSLQTGEGGNIISDEASLHGTLRAFDEGVRAQVKKRMEEMSESVAKAFRAKAKVEYGGGCPTLVNDEKLSALTHKASVRLLGKDRAFTSQGLGGDTREKSGGSEDFAYISHEVPSVMIALSAGERAKGYTYPLHHPKADFDESVLYIASALYANTAIAWLNEK